MPGNKMWRHKRAYPHIGSEHPVRHLYTCVRASAEYRYAAKGHRFPTGSRGMAHFLAAVPFPASGTGDTT